MRVIDRTIELYGRVDCLFNNAGGPAPTGSITSVSVEGFDAAMALLVRSVMLGTKHAGKAMIAQRSGSIVNNASVAAHLAGYSSSMIYGAAKAAVKHLTTCTAMELGEHNVRVNSISPGAIATGILAKALGMDHAAADGIAEKMMDGFAKAQPIPRAGIPDDIAQCVLFLASDRSSFINGTDIIVDGGLIGGKHYSMHQEQLRQTKAALGIRLIRRTPGRLCEERSDEASISQPMKFRDGLLRCARNDSAGQTPRSGWPLADHPSAHQQERSDRDVQKVQARPLAKAAR